jgi:hypothetical protein
MMTLTDLKYANRKAVLFLTLVVLVSGVPRSARAITILPTMDGIFTFYWALCDNGFLAGPWTDLGTALNAGGIFCSQFGGIAQITDQEVIDARADPTTCAAASSITIEEDLGAAGTQQITQEEFDAIVAATGGVGQILTNLTVASVLIRGTETWPDPPIPLLSRISISEIFNDEDGDGSLIGGSTLCAAMVPASSHQGLWLSLALMVIGLFLLTRRNSRNLRWNW